MSVVDITYRPIVAWPGKRTAYPIRAPFKSAWPSTWNLLRTELGHLKVEHGVLELACEERNIRPTGELRGDARILEPSVILSFDHPDAGPLRYPCDRFWEWRDNVRAIALGLEALRKVARYGIVSKAEQYTGWKAIPATTGATLTTEQAAKVLGGITGRGHVTILADKAQFETARRIALNELHPDRPNGNRERFNDAQVAIGVLAAHHGVRA